MSYKIEIEFTDDLRLARWEFSPELIELLKVDPAISLEINMGPLLAKLQTARDASEKVKDEHKED